MGTEALSTCTVCSGLFNMETEGGCEGFIGILPVAFCPTCKAGIYDFCDQDTELAFKIAYQAGVQMHCRHQPDPVNLSEEMEVAWETFQEETMQ